MNKQEIISIAKRANSTLPFQFPYDIEDWVNNKSMVMENYHKHTMWSNISTPDSTTTIDQFMNKIDERGSKCYFSGEHGNQGEWISAYDLCSNTKNEDYRSKHGLHSPISFRYSTEAYWVKNRHEQDRTNCHMVLVARNYTGVRKLNYILSMANDDGYYGKPRIDLELLFTLSPEDVYVTSACIAGWKYEDATEIWLSIWQHFKDSFFLEFQCNNTDEQKELNRKILNISNSLGINTIIGLDTHYISEEDRIKRSNYLQRKNFSYPEEDGWYMDFPSGDVVFDRMKEQGVVPADVIVRSMMNTHVFIDGCKDFELSRSFKIPILDQYKGMDYEKRSEYLKEFLISKYHEEPVQNDERFEGLMYEFGEIKDSGTVDYFLTNKEIVATATSPEFGGQLTKTSRGSAASYYCSKLSGFTTIDRFDCEVPIFPQRFITKDRILSSGQMPDIDLNCSSSEPFLKSARVLLGEHSCYPLLAVGKFGEKSGFKMYADVNGIEPSVANEITQSIDKYNEAIKQADDDEKDDIVIEDYITNPIHLDIFNRSKDYRGLIEQARIHPCGHLIFSGDQNNKDVVGYGDIRYEVGLIRVNSKNKGTSDLIAFVEGSYLDMYGFVKDDFLIVDVVGLIYKLYENIGMNVPSVSELRNMVEGDNKVWDLYANGITCCLNQCEKRATTARVSKYKPVSVKELAAFIAGIRPGFKSLIDGFINRIPYTNKEPEIDKLLEDSFQYMLYQEAVMRIFGYLGIPMNESYDTIKKISKKKLVGEKLAHVEGILRDHWLQNIGNLDNFEPVYKVIKDSARYSFNAPHALAMAYDSLYEAWQKAHYTSNFYETALNHYRNKGDKDKVSDLLNEAMVKFGYTIGKYKYGNDNLKFTVDDKNKIIYPSLATVKTLSVDAVKDLKTMYDNGTRDFISVLLNIKGSSVNKPVLQRLIMIGFFSQYGSVKKLLKVYSVFNSMRGSNGEGRKTLKKSAVKDILPNYINIEDFATDKLKSGGSSATQWSNVDWLGIVREVANKEPDNEFPAYVLASYQIEILGYSDVIDKDCDWQWVVISDLNTNYSPKFKAYSANNGKTIEMKVRKKPTKGSKGKAFSNEPFEDFSIMRINKATRKQRNMNKDGEWVPIPGAFDWWVEDYFILDRKELGA